MLIVLWAKTKDEEEAKLHDWRESLHEVGINHSLDDFLWAVYV